MVGGGLESIVGLYSNTIYCCLFLFMMKGLYGDIANGVIEEASGPMLIHANKSKAKKKEAQELRETTLWQNTNRHNYCIMMDTWNGNST